MGLFQPTRQAEDGLVPFHQANLPIMGGMAQQVHSHANHYLSFVLFLAFIHFFSFKIVFFFSVYCKASKIKCLLRFR